MKGKFESGEVIATSAILGEMESSKSFLYFCLNAFTKHMDGDWGDVDAEDKTANEQAIVTGGRIVSSYRFRKDCDILIITEAERSRTTLLFAREY